MAIMAIMAILLASYRPGPTISVKNVKKWHHKVPFLTFLQAVIERQDST